MANNLIRRYSDGERWNHWITAITFILLACSGLAFFHPSFWFLSGVLGGGELSRFLHPIIGVVMFVSFMIFALKKFSENLINQTDKQWLSQIGDVINNRDERLPEAGKYNAGQKAAYWVMLISMILLMGSGIVMWHEFFSHLFSIAVVRAAIFVHAISSVVLILTIIVHVYAALWVKGSMQAMLSGVVSRAWAKHHHPAWFRSVDKS
ncbi:MAG: formate dehydrogenase subunit gamma [Betaproteobacteria bacterium]|nr:formate dehydrogenase subunit gamma [Betaproteobacteria bacterium]